MGKTLPSTTLRTSGDAGSIVKMTSERRATSSAERAPSPPSLMSAATGSGLMSKDSVAKPFLCKLDAMGRPIR
ncbi:MAG TPA: hypothetical protein VN326_01550, partial [Casimicrobiaceae bacterium]|nr:hypothetical protein [Casimicrobiaceae bacterium]